MTASTHTGPLDARANFWSIPGVQCSDVIFDDARQKLYVSGKGTHKEANLTGSELSAVIEAGRGFVVPEKGMTPYRAKSKEGLLKDLGNWSPVVRTRAGKALAEKADDATVQEVLSALIRLRLAGVTGFAFE